MSRKIRTSMLAGMIALALAPCASMADEPSIGGNIGVYSQYVWRGVASSSSKAAVQGDLSVSYGGFSAGMWFSNAYPSPEPQFAGKDVVEFDWTLDYSGSIGDSGVGYSIGGIYYTYLYDAHSNFVETYLGLSYDAVVSPSVTVYYTAKGTQSGFYKTGDVWVDVGLATQLAGFDLSATGSFVNWKQDRIKRPVVAGVDTYKNGFALVALAVSKDLSIGDVTLTPSLMVTMPTISRSADGQRYIYGTPVKTEFIGGVNVAY